MISSGCGSWSCAWAAEARNKAIRMPQIVFTQQSLLLEATKATTFVAPIFDASQARGDRTTNFSFSKNLGWFGVPPSDGSNGLDWLTGLQAVRACAVARHAKCERDARDDPVYFSSMNN